MTKTILPALIIAASIGVARAEDCLVGTVNDAGIECCRAGDTTCEARNVAHLCGKTNTACKAQMWRLFSIENGQPQQQSAGDRLQPAAGRITR
jgi:hypothetical protein